MLVLAPECLAHARTLPQTWRYLICFFLYSDTYSTIGSIGILFAKQEFQLFDKILSIQNVFTKKPLIMQNADSSKRQEIRK